MKKNFSLQEANKKTAIIVDAIKRDINKYLARESRKAVPEGVDYWDFDCKVGAEATTAKTVHFKEIGKSIDAVVLEKATSVYIEILAKPGVRKKLVRPESRKAEGEVDGEYTDDEVEVDVDEE